jgi:hypothetical protein
LLSFIRYFGPLFYFCYGNFLSFHLKWG